MRGKWEGTVTCRESEKQYQNIYLRKVSIFNKRKQLKESEVYMVQHLIQY